MMERQRFLNRIQTEAADAWDVALEDGIPEDSTLEIAALDELIETLEGMREAREEAHRDRKKQPPPPP